MSAPADIEERTRLAAARVREPGLARHAGTAYIVGLMVFVGGALHVIQTDPDLAGPGMVATIIALIVLGVVLVAFSLELLGQRLAHQHAAKWALAGDFERASRGHFALLERRFVLPHWRATYATSLATSALMAGHPERAIVLLRAIEASKTLARRFESAHRDATALSLFALNQVAAARALADKPLRSPYPFTHRSAPRSEVGLVIDALAGTLQAASEAAIRAEERYRTPWVVTTQVDYAARRSYGWLLIAYAWERVARSRPAEERLDVERRRDEAIAQVAAAGPTGVVPPHFYRYLANVAPDFVAFADRFQPTRP